MPQRRQLTWTELRVGLFVLVGLSVLAAGIFYVTGAGPLSPKYRIKTYLPDASQLARGAPVRLDGVEVGNVESISLVPRTAGKPMDRKKNIEIVMRINRNYQHDILTDSVASPRTEGLLGNRYVTITRGFTGAPIPDNGVIPGSEEKAMAEVVERSAEVLGNLSALSTDVRELIGGVQQGRGTLGKLLTDEQAYRHLNNILAKSEAMVTNIQDGQGTLGKLIYDPTLYDQTKETMTNASAMLRDVRAGKGSLGKFVSDDALYDKLRETSANFASASAKLNENTTTVGKMFSDPKLYDNLAALTGDMRLLIGDFRQNPKKFLHIKVTLF